MTGQKYGWQDSLGGVEPGFADARPMQFGAAQNTGDEDGNRPVGASSPGAGATGEQEWSQNRLE